MTVHAGFTTDRLTPVYLSAIQAAIFENDIHLNRVSVYMLGFGNTECASLGESWRESLSRARENMSRSKLRACDRGGVDDFVANSRNNFAHELPAGVLHISRVFVSIINLHYA